MSGYSEFHGREGLALDRYVLERTDGASIELAEDCDFCQATLGASETAPQTVWWRTPEKEVSTNWHAMSAATALVGVTVKTKTVSWYEQQGTYFLCQSCRERLRPKLTQAVLYAVVAAVVAIPIGLILGDGLPISFRMVVPGMAFIGGLYWGFRSKFKGFPASSGFGVHRTTFDNRDRHIGILVGALGFFLLPWLGGFFTDSGDEIVTQLARADRAERSPRQGVIRERLEELNKLTPEGLSETGDLILKGWITHKGQSKVKFYPQVEVYMEAIRVSLEKKEHSLDTRAVVNLFAHDTPAIRLAREYEHSTGPVYESEAEFKKAIKRVAKRTHVYAPEVVVPVLKIYEAQGDGGKRLDLLKLIHALEEASANSNSFVVVSKAFEQEVKAHPGSYRP